jgi:lysyl endopeptidase
VRTHWTTIAKTTIVIGACFAGIAPVTAGVYDDAAPVALRQAALPQKLIDTYEIRRLDFDAIALEDVARDRDGEPPRYAIPHGVNVTPENSGTWEMIDVDNAMWRLVVVSPDAKSINFGFTQYTMPEHGRLTLYSANGSMVIRPFTAADNDAHGQLWTPPVAGDEVVIEVVLPAKFRKDLKLVLGSINVGYKTFGQMLDEIEDRSGSCNVDVVCPEGDDWRAEISSNAAISTGGSIFCSGVMVNNTARDKTPYFLTANHCGISSGNAASLVCFWNYDNSFCRPVGSSGGQGDGPTNQFNTGSIWRAGYGPSDFTLVELDDPVDPSYRVGFSGWSHSSSPASSIVGIHHPDGEEKRISFENAPTTLTSYLGTSIPGDGTHWRIEDWDLGTTEPGSSGSPIYNPQHQIVGQLHGGYAACGNDDSDWYGAFHVSWTGGGSSSSRLSDWLDPLGTGETGIETISPFGISVSPSSNVLSLGLVGGPFTNDSIVYELSNQSGDPADYTVTLGTGTAPLLLNGSTSPINSSLTSGSTANITVALASSASSLGMGTYTRDVIFYDSTNDIETIVAYTLEIGTTNFSVDPADGLITGGQEGGPFTGSIVYTVTSDRPSPVQIEVAGDQPWLSINGSSSTMLNLNGVGDDAVITVSINSAANGLAIGTYSGNVTFTNLSGGGGDASRPISLEVGRVIYAASGLPVAIPDNTTVQATINITDAYCIGDVDVELDISHTYIGDLEVDVISPEGTVVRLHDRSGGSSEDIVATYDDEGSPTPEGPGVLSDFDGEIVTGVWTLRVSDNASQDTGNINMFNLAIVPSGTLCPPEAGNIGTALSVDTSDTIMLDGTSAYGGALSYTITSLPTVGTIEDPLTDAVINSVPYVLAAGGDSVIYNAGSTGGADSFTYFVTEDGLDSLEATVNIEIIAGLVYGFTFDSDPGWDTTGLWAFGQPTGQAGSSGGPDPTSGYSGVNVYGYNLGGGYTNNMDEETLTSPALDMTDVTNAEVRFQRWLGMESATYDHAAFQISTNGSSWTNLWSHSGSSFTDSDWVEEVYDISAIADGQATVYLRWVMGDTDGSVTYCGWNIDDVLIFGDLPQINDCPWDSTDDGEVGVEDFFALLQHWGPCPAVCPWDSTDDDEVGVEDFFALLQHWGPCP